MLLEEARGTRGERRLSHGVIVGGQRWCEIDVQDRLTIAAAKDVLIEDVSQMALTARSLWKPDISFGGLLYRTGAFAMFAHPEEGDTVVELRKFVSFKVDGCALVCAYAEEYKYCEHINGDMRCVRPTQNTIMIEAYLISRKVMLTPMLNQEDDEGEELMYTLVDYKRRIFPVTSGTVVIPYYPEEHDMVEVKGDDGEKWMAHVNKFSIARKTIKARFFQQHPTQQHKWIPEQSPDQVIHFDSILSIATGVWDVKYTCWSKEI